MEGAVDADHADAVAVGQPLALFDGVEGDGLAELLVGVPDMGGVEAGGQPLDVRSGHAAGVLLVAAAKEVVEVEGLDRVVGADAVAGGELAEAGGLPGLVPGVAAVSVGGFDDAVVQIDGEDEHEGENNSERCLTPTLSESLSEASGMGALNQTLRSKTRSASA